MATPRRLQAAPFAARVPGLRQLENRVENRSSQGAWPRVAATIALTRAGHRECALLIYAYLLRHRQELFAPALEPGSFLESARLGFHPSTLGGKNHQVPSLLAKTTWRHTAPTSCVSRHTHNVR